MQVISRGSKVIIDTREPFNVANLFQEYIVEYGKARLIARYGQQEVKLSAKRVGHSYQIKGVSYKPGNDKKFTSANRVGMYDPLVRRVTMDIDLIDEDAGYIGLSEVFEFPGPR